MADKKPSPREELQTNIFEWLIEQKKFNAPYGVLTGLDPVGKKGYVRTITFGIARNLDATMKIFSPTDIRVTARGPSCTKYAGNFKSFDQIKARYS